MSEVFKDNPSGKYEFKVLAPLYGCQALGVVWGQLEQLSQSEYRIGSVYFREIDGLDRFLSFVDLNIMVTYWPNERCEPRTLCSIKLNKSSEDLSGSILLLRGYIKKYDNDQLKLMIKSRERGVFYINLLGVNPDGFEVEVGKKYDLEGYLENGRWVARFKQEIHESKEHLKRGVRGNTRKVVEEADISISKIYELLQKEEKRVIVNAKLKIVLKALPKNIQDADDFLWIPLENKPTGVPGSLSIPSTPIDLLITKKSWKNIKKRVDVVVGESGGLPPIYVFEAFVGIVNNRIAAVMSGFQVMPGKAEQKEQEKK